MPSPNAGARVAPITTEVATNDRARREKVPPDEDRGSPLGRQAQRHDETNQPHQSHPPPIGLNQLDRRHVLPANAIVRRTTITLLSRHTRSRTCRRASESFRGEGIAAVAGARTAEAVVPAIEPDDRYPGIVRREAADVAASRCRQGDAQLCAGSNTNAIVRALRVACSSAGRSASPGTVGGAPLARADAVTEGRRRMSPRCAWSGSPGVERRRDRFGACSFPTFT